MEIQERFRSKLQAALVEKGWSQADLAREMGVTRALVNQYLQGRRTPGLDVVAKFAKALEVESINLLDEKPLRFCLAHA